MRHAEQKAAAGQEQLLGQEHRERGADRTADDPEAHPSVLELEQFGVVAGPVGRWRRMASPAQGTQNVAVWVEQADLGHVRLRQALLPPRLAQQISRLEDRRGRMLLIGEQWRHALRIFSLCHIGFLARPSVARQYGTRIPTALYRTCSG